MVDDVETFLLDAVVGHTVFSGSVGVVATPIFVLVVVDGGGEGDGLVIDVFFGEKLAGYADFDVDGDLV